MCQLCGGAVCGTACANIPGMTVSLGALFWLFVTKRTPRFVKAIKEKFS